MGGSVRGPPARVDPDILTSGTAVPGIYVQQQTREVQQYAEDTDMYL